MRRALPLLYLMLLLTASGLGTLLFRQGWAWAGDPVGWWEALFLSVSAVVGCGLFPRPLEAVLSDQGQWIWVGLALFGAWLALGFGARAVVLMLESGTEAGRTAGWSSPGRRRGRWSRLRPHGLLGALCWSAVLLGVLLSCATVGLTMLGSDTRQALPQASLALAGVGGWHVPADAWKQQMVLGGLAAVAGLGLAAILLWSRAWLERVATGTAVIYVLGVMVVLGSVLMTYWRPIAGAGGAPAAVVREHQPAEPPLGESLARRRLDRAAFQHHFADAGGWTLAALAGGPIRHSVTEAPPAGQLALGALMLIGSGAGGVGGGLGAGLMATLFLGVLYAARGRAEALGGPVARAAVVLSLWLGLSLLGTVLLLVMVEPAPIGALAFEAIAALSGGGLSRGGIGEWSHWGQGVLILAMLLGRVLPVAAMAGIASSTRPMQPVPGEAGVARGGVPV